VGCIVGIAAEIAEVLHQHKGAVEFVVDESLVLDYLTHSLAAGQRAVVETGNQRTTLCRRQREACMGEQRVNELRVRQAAACGHKRWVLDPVVNKSLLVGFE